MEAGRGSDGQTCRGGPWEVSPCQAVFGSNNAVHVSVHRDLWDPAVSLLPPPQGLDTSEAPAQPGLEAKGYNHSTTGKPLGSTIWS